MEFETVVMTNQLKFMPSLGIGIGYQLSPPFSVGLEHKVTYALTSEINGFNDDNIMINIITRHSELILIFSAIEEEVSLTSKKM